MRKNLFTVLLVALFTLNISVSLSFSQQIQSPEQWYGFKMGADYKLARWDKIMEYFKFLDRTSDKIVVRELGKSTMGNPYILAIISSSANMARLDHYQSISQRLADPRGLSEEEVERLVREGKTVVLLCCANHATEVGSTQMASELAHRLISEDTPEIREILDNVIFLMIPCLNPDGQIMVVDWYNEYLGTPYESSGMPWLYHKYVGHDNNRDGYMLTQQETKLQARIMYHEWHPQLYVDMHQMGFRGARYYVPPYHDPGEPNIDPLIWRESMMVGAHMSTKLVEHGKTGVETGAGYTGWWMGGIHQVTNLHNIVGMLTEAASVRIASPRFISRDQLSRGSGRGRQEYNAMLNFPDPWPGGWWKLRDIVEYEEIGMLAVLELAAKYRYAFLHNRYLMARRAIERGKNEPPYAFVVPNDQRDPLTASKMLNTLMAAGVEVRKTRSKFVANGLEYVEGTHVILMDQPLRNYAKSILEPQDYPDRWVYPEGVPERPYDVPGWTLCYQMGVKAVPAKQPLEGEFEVVEKAQLSTGQLVTTERNYPYLIGHETNDSFIAINRLIKEGVEVYWTTKPLSSGGRTFPAGTILVPFSPDLPSKMDQLAKDLGLQIYQAESGFSGEVYELKSPRLAMYKPWGGNMAEGWNRWVLEQFEFPYTSIRNAEIQAAGLNDRYDVIILADQGADSIIKPAERDIPRPPQYSGGIEEEGVKNLKRFVQEGGTLITLNAASNLPIEHFDIPVKNALKDVETKDFYCPGSILKIKVNKDNPIAYGMGAEAAAYFFRGSLAFNVEPSEGKDGVKVVAQYLDESPLMSGWLIGSDKLFKKPALIEVKLGKGRIIMAGFKTQFRAQSHGTFKFLFNSIYYGAARLTGLP